MISPRNNTILEFVLRAIVAIIYLLSEKVIPPFERIITRPAWDRILYPHKSNTIPIWLVAVLGGIVPIVFLIVTHFWHRHYLKEKELKTMCDGEKDTKRFPLNKHNFFAADLIDIFWAYSLSILVNGLITNFIKLLVGRPRPDFFNRCYDQIDIYNSVAVRTKLDSLSSLNDLQCTGDPHEIMEGRKSFPSGHTSSSFAAFVFVSFYIWGKCSAFARTGHIQAWRYIAGVPTFLLALYIGISRTQDYRHHWEDVTIGAFIGIFSAYSCYRLYFPSISSDLCNLSYRQLQWIMYVSGTPKHELENYLHSNCEGALDTNPNNKWEMKHAAVLRETLKYGDLIKERDVKEIKSRMRKDWNHEVHQNATYRNSGSVAPSP